MTPPNVLQDVLTEGDTGAPFFSDRDGSEEPRAVDAQVRVEYLRELVESLRLKVVRAEMLGHRTLPLDTIRSVFGWD